MEAPLPTIASTDLVSSLVESLAAWILEHCREVGTSLPSEQELCASFGVSRTALREALSRLRMLGLVEQRRKRGMRSGEPSPFSGLAMVAKGVRAAEQVQDLLELRVVLELGMADALLTHLQVEDFVQLEAIVLDEEADPFDVVHLRGCDRAFHTCYQRVVPNRQLQRLQQSLSLLLDGRVYGGSHTPPGHADLLAALRHGSAAKWRTAIQSHLHDTYRPVLASLV